MLTKARKLTFAFFSGLFKQAIAQKPGLVKDPHRWLAETKVRLLHAVVLPSLQGILQNNQLYNTRLSM